MSAGGPGGAPRLVDLLRELLPAGREWGTFLLDLVPLLGFLFFADSAVELVLPVVAELLFAEAAAYVRIAAHGTWRGTRLMDGLWPSSPGGWLGFLLLPGPLGLVVGLALLAIVMAANKVLFLVAEGCLSFAVQKDPDLSYLQLVRGLGDGERIAFAGLCAGAALRTVVGLFAFFREGRYRGEGAGWLLLGWPSIDPANRMRRTVGGLVRWWDGLTGQHRAAGSGTASVVATALLALALAPGLVVVPLLGFASGLGAAWIIVAKALLSLWLDRLLAPPVSGWSRWRPSASRT